MCIDEGLALLCSGDGIRLQLFKPLLIAIIEGLSCGEVRMHCACVVTDYVVDEWTHRLRNLIVRKTKPDRNTLDERESCRE